MTRFITITLVAVAAITAGLAFGSPATARGMHADSPAYLNRVAVAVPEYEVHDTFVRFADGRPNHSLFH